MTESDDGRQSQLDNNLDAIYAHRFPKEIIAGRAKMWETLVTHFFQGIILNEQSVLDLGAGYCEFINSVKADNKIAIDLNPDSSSFANPDVRVIRTASDDLNQVQSGSVTTVFTSNFFEHLKDVDTLLATLRECHRVLTFHGQIIVLMPNIRNLPGAYWDYLDHRLPLTHHSLTEALTLTGFKVVRVEDKFLPYTASSLRRMPPNFLITAYLKIPFAWKLLGKQMLVVALKE